ncbi:MAG: hypothetical protein KA403_02760 [Candidatus Omnitrophica bacterium]|nr:hypothetical protein [Candidatus Omnitrophota bacterium]
MRRYFYLIIAFMLLGAVPSVYPASKVAPTHIVTSQYFAVYGPAELDILLVLKKLNYDYFLQSENYFSPALREPKQVLADTLDAIFQESSRILGVHIYTFQATIEFLQDQETMKVVIYKMTGINMEERAFYLDDTKTIYLSINDLTVGILGHEMAHAIISHYFGAPPPQNIQEILAGYVDYSLGKTVKTPVSP